MADFELRHYMTGDVGWIAARDNDTSQLVVHIKNSENPFGDLIIRDAKDAMALRNLVGDFLLHLNHKGEL